MHPFEGHIQLFLLSFSGVLFTEIKYFVSPSIINMELLYNSFYIYI